MARIASCSGARCPTSGSRPRARALPIAWRRRSRCRRRSGFRP
jgi:hypothetical protein